MANHYPVNPRLPAADKDRDALYIQFMVKDVLATNRELEKRGIAFDRSPQSIQTGSALYNSELHTPYGNPVGLWGVTEFVDPPAAKTDEINNSDEDDLVEDEDDDKPLEGEEIHEDDEGELVDDEDTDVDETGLPLDNVVEGEDGLDFDEDEAEDEDDVEEEEELLEFDEDDLDDEDDFDDDEDDFDEDDR